MASRGSENGWGSQRGVAAAGERECGPCLGRHLGVAKRGRIPGMSRTYNGTDSSGLDVRAEDGTKAHPPVCL